MATLPDAAMEIPPLQFNQAEQKNEVSKEKKSLTLLGQCPIITHISKTMPSTSKPVSKQTVTTALGPGLIHGPHFEGLLSR